jgi:hypothetical protein
MQVRVENQVGPRGVPMPHRIQFGGRRVNVIEIIDQWHGSDHRYVKVKGDDGCLYILRYDAIREDWQLTMFESVRAQLILGQPHGETLR